MIGWGGIFLFVFISELLCFHMSGTFFKSGSTVNTKFLNRIRNPYSEHLTRANVPHTINFIADMLISTTSLPNSHNSQICPNFSVLFDNDSRSFRNFLTDFWPMFPFYNPWKHQKTNGLNTNEMDFVENICILSCPGPYVPTLLCKSPYSVRMWGNTDQKNSEYGHRLRRNDVQCCLSNIYLLLCKKNLHLKSIIW